MSQIIRLIDTCVFTNILNVPKCAQNSDAILEEFQEYQQLGCDFILPMATIMETGNHIAHYGDGNQRRKNAAAFMNEVTDAFAGNAPYRISNFPETSEMRECLPLFPEMAMKEIGFGDLTIIKEYEKTCLIFKTAEVLIWTLDTHLQGYHQNPST